jgi:hypothetical protein
MVFDKAWCSTGMVFDKHDVRQALCSSGMVFDMRNVRQADVVQKAAGM